MPVRRTCPECDERWAQRHARFCGSCGATLRETSGPPRPRMPKRAGWALVVLSLGALVVLALTVTGLELTSPTPDPDVDLEPEVQEPSPSPLSDDEADRLRAQADPDALRCEPRGCEAWRLTLTEGQDGNLGVVSFDNGSVALVEEQPDNDGVRVVTVDPDTGGTRWTLDLLDDEGAAGRVLLEPLDEHALVLAGVHLFAVDQGGEVVWTRDLGPLADGVDSLWQHLATNDVVLVAASETGSASELDPEPRGDLVAAVDPTDGEVRWSVTSTRLALGPDLVVAVDDDGRLTALEPSSGERLWQGPRIGDEGRLAVADRWVIANEPGERRMRLFHREDGRELDVLPADPVTRPYAIGDDLVALVAPRSEPSDEASDETPSDAPGPPDDGFTLLRVGLDGSVRWRTQLRPPERSFGCCEIDADGSGWIRVEIDDERYGYALDTGELVSREPVGLDQRRSQSWELPSGIRVERSGAGDRLVLRDDDEITVSGQPPLHVATQDPLTVTDGRHLMGIDLSPAD